MKMGRLFYYCCIGILVDRKTYYMKKYILFLLIIFTQSLKGQVTLENIYPNTIGSAKFLMYTQLDSSTYNYVLFDPQNSQFTIYNLNHSVYLNVTIPITYAPFSSQYQIAFVTKSLFDCDTSNIEYALSFLGDGSPNTYPKRFYVYRTNGTQLVNIDSCCFMNFSDGWKYGPEYNKPVVNTPVGTKLILRCIDGSTRVYAVCGSLADQIEEIEDENILGNPFPNPTHDLITIPYTLPDNEKNGTVKIYDIAGKEIKSFTVDNNFKSITLTTAELPSGTYYYQLVTSKGLADTKKIIKVE